MRSSLTFDIKSEPEAKKDFRRLEIVAFGAIEAVKFQNAERVGEVANIDWRVFRNHYQRRVGRSEPELG